MSERFFDVRITYQAPNTDDLFADYVATCLRMLIAEMPRRFGIPNVALTFRDGGEYTQTHLIDDAAREDPGEANEPPWCSLHQTYHEDGSRHVDAENWCYRHDTMKALCRFSHA